MGQSLPLRFLLPVSQSIRVSRRHVIFLGGPLGSGAPFLIMVGHRFELLLPSQ